MKRKLSFVLLVCIIASFVLLPTTGSACIWGFSTEFHGSVSASQDYFPVPHGHPVDTKSSKVRNTLGYLTSDYAAHDFEGSIDYGVYLLYDKQYHESELVFQDVAKRWPDKYEGAANYGTILEVNDKIKEAIKWIKKAMKINPDSHEGSEWIHLKILESKLHPDQAVVGSLLTGVDFGAEKIPLSELDRQGLTTLQKHLFYQLNERITFIPPKDKYIAALLFELGNVTLALGDKKSAVRIYELAEKYGFEDPLLDLRVKLAKSDETFPVPQPPVVVDTVASQDTVDSLFTKVGDYPDFHAPESKPFPWLPLLIGSGIALAVLGAVYWVVGRRRG